MSTPDPGEIPVGGLLDLTGRVAVVTGAASGIGAACARRLAEAGARVYRADLAFPADEDGRVPLDVTDPDAVTALARRVDRETGRLDVWVNAAGIFPRRALLDITLDEWRTVAGVNVEGSLLGAQAAGRLMADRDGGVIVSVSSTVAHRVNGNSAHYRASKAALLALTQNIAVELGPHGVRAIAVCPGLVRTEGVERTLDDTVRAGLQRYAERLPLGRAAVADDVARAVLFAASPMAAYLTGTALTVDGGELAR